MQISRSHALRLAALLALVVTSQSGRSAVAARVSPLTLSAAPVEQAGEITLPPPVPTGALSLAPLAAENADRPPARTLADDALYACACGCGVFDVGTSTMLPQGTGGLLWLEYDYQDQNRNFRSTAHAPAADNGDKAIRTDFYTLGLQYLFTRAWGAQIEIPVDHRYFKGTDAATGDVFTTAWTALGDIRLKGIYSGFFEDQSLGIELGVKLPSGEFKHRLADRDTQVGTGSTDILVGGYYRTSLAADQRWDAFFQVEADIPVGISDGYRPGIEIDGAAGVYFTGLTLHGVRIAPIAQVIASERTSDGGDNSAHPVASGYQRILLSPGLEFDLHPLMIYADVEFPVYQHTTGDQLVASTLFKVIFSYTF